MCCKDELESKANSNLACISTLSQNRDLVDISTLSQIRGPNKFSIIAILRFSSAITQLDKSASSFQH